VFSHSDPKTWIKLVTALFILRLLKKRATCGNRIAVEISRITGDALRPNPNVIYPLLRQMEEGGYVEGRWENPDKRGRKVYTVTAAGLARLGALQDTVRAKMRERARRHAAIRAFLCSE